MTQTQDVPASACRLTVDIETLAEPQTDEHGVETRRFRGTANSGRIFRHWLFGQLAIDMETLDVRRQDLPVLRDHWPDQIVGMTDKITATRKGIDVEGTILGVTEHGREVMGLLSAGFPMQMSVYVPPAKMLRVGPGETHKVNGHRMTGPGVVFQGSHLREVTMTALGADEATGASALTQRHRATTLHVPVDPQGQGEMDEDQDRTDQTGGDSQPLTAASLREQHRATYDEVHAQGVSAERERIAAIQQASRGIPAQLVHQAITEGWTLADATAKFLAHLQEHPPRAEPEPGDHKASRLAAIREATDGGSGVDDPEPEASTFREGSDGRAKLAALPEGEERWKAQFHEHGDPDEGMSAAELQEEFGDVELYIACKRHPENERQRARRRARS